MSTLHQSICTVIPPHILRHIAAHGRERESWYARATLRHQANVPVVSSAALMQLRDSVGPLATRKSRRVFDAGGRDLLPGRVVLDESRPGAPADAEARQAFHACGIVYDFFAGRYLRHSIDDKGMRIEASVHYGPDYNNACWNGRQLIFGEGDGVHFTSFTASLDVVAHELTHGIEQHSARLPYCGQSGALAEHIADVFGKLVSDYALWRTATQSDWRIGAGVLSPAVHGTALRSMINPGTAYDDPVLGRDPQPCHMRDYVDSPLDNGGVHLNSGILNRAFALAAIALGGYAWKVLGRIWYRVLTSALTPEATFHSFAEDTVRVAGELYSHGEIQRTVANAWAAVGLPVHARAAEGARSIVELVQRKYPLFIPEPQRQLKGKTMTHKHITNLSQITFEDIDQHMKGVDLAELRDGQTFLPEPSETRIEQLAKVYRAARPVLKILVAFPIPPAWRAAVTLLLQAIEAVVTPGATMDFKAGRDLEE